MSENTKTDIDRGARLSVRDWLVAIAIGLFYLIGISIPLLGPDEPRYAQVAREMYQRADWVTPTLGDYTWFEKPALLYWFQIAAYNVFGVTEFAARLGSALSGIGVIAATFLIIRADRAGNGSLNFAKLVTLVMASTAGVIVFSRGATFDVVVSFPLTASILGFFVFDRGPRKYRPLGLFTFYFFIGVALLAKGLIGIVFPFAIVGFYYLLSRRLPDRTFLISVAWGTLVAAAVAALWYWPMYARHGYKFIDQFIIQHHFQRFTSNKYLHPQPFYFFFFVLPLMTIPWLPFFAVGLWRSAKTVVGEFLSKTKTAPRDDAGDGASGDLIRLSFAWLLVPLVFFSFSGSKLPGYVLPSIPPAMIITAEAIRRFIDGRAARRKFIYSLVGATFAVCLLIIFAFVPRYAETDSVKSLMAAASAAGYGDAKVVGLHTISYNAEFYASGRIVRNEDGTQKKLLGPTEVLTEIRYQGGRPLLVIVPREYLYQLQQAAYLDARVIKDNGEIAVVAVAERGN